MINLNGHFKVDVYNQEGVLTDTTNYFNNFITSTGLSYPFDIPFADCFKCLSVGSGNNLNTMETTGVHSGIPLCSFLTGFIDEGCKSIVHRSGVEMYRAWRVPAKDFFLKETTISELAVSPSDGSSTSTLKGNRGAVAFSRVLKNVTIEEGNFASITYKLNFIVDTSVKTFGPFIGLTTPNQDYGSHVLWQTLTGKSKLLHQGIRFVADEKDVKEYNDLHGNTQLTIGKTFISDLGEPLEPSAKVAGESDWYAYFSTDNTQFMTEPWWGGKIRTGFFKPWNTNGINMASGFSDFYWDIKTQISDSKTSTNYYSEQKTPTIEDHRKDKERLKQFKAYRTTGAKIPDPFPGPSGSIFKEISATQMDQFGYGVQNIVTSYSSDFVVTQGAYIPESRTRHITRAASWQHKNVNLDGDPGAFIKYKSLVFKHKNYAFMDSLFGSRDMVNYPQGGLFQPTINNYVNFTPVGEIDGPWTGTQGAFPFQDSKNGLSITWKLAWSAPCNGVVGCVDP